jgi:hypothetical protein
MFLSRASGLKINDLMEGLYSNINKKQRKNHFLL